MYMHVCAAQEMHSWLVHACKYEVMMTSPATTVGREGGGGGGGYM